MLQHGVHGGPAPATTWARHLPDTSPTTAMTHIAIAEILDGTVSDRGDLVGRHRRRVAGVLLPDRSLGRGDVVCRHRRAASGDRVDDGHDRVGAGGVPLARARSPDRDRKSTRTNS